MMSGTSEDRPRDELFEELWQLVEPRTPYHLLQDATGLFVPGFTALPAVTVAEAKPTGSSKFPERFSTGQLYSFEVERESGGVEKRMLTFFTPLADIDVPPVRFSPTSMKSRDQQTIQVDSQTGWNDIDLHFAWLPWDSETMTDPRKMSALIKAYSSRDALPVKLRVSMLAGETEITVQPEWGIGRWMPASSVESIVFPLNYARRLIDPYIFRIRMSPVYTLPGGKQIHLRDSITLRFEYPEDDLMRLHSTAGLSAAGTAGFSIIGNAIPMANIDLKAWEPDVTYADFVRTVNMKPLGFAGVVPYKKSDDLDAARASLDREIWSELPSSTQIGLEFDSDGEIVSRYALPDPDAGADRQMLFWMTYGDEVNNLEFRYTDAEQIQPMHVVSASLRQAVTAMPCFGGCTCEKVYKGNLYKSLMLNYASPPQMLLHKDTLLFTVKDLLARLGYRDLPVTGPLTELRVIGEERQRVTVIYIRETTVNPLRSQHMAAIQDYLDQRAPLGSKILVEVR